MSLLTVENLGIDYRTRQGRLRAVEGVTFGLEAGRSLGFVGESGCGKTTIGMALMRLLPPNAEYRTGRILLEGQDVVTLSEEGVRGLRWAKIAMVFQAAMNALNPVQRVERQIVEAILTHEPDVPKEEARGRVEELFRLVGIPEHRMRDFPHQYSGGMRQRAVIAMALACRPRLIVADEPTTALDVIVQDQILEEIKTLQEHFKIGMLFISHDISIVADVCHDIGIMYAGQLVEFGPREAVFSSPAHPYTQALLSSFPTLVGRKEKLRSIRGETPNLVSPPAGCRFCDRCPNASPACREEAQSWTQISPCHKTLCCRC